MEVRRTHRTDSATTAPDTAARGRDSPARPTGPGPSALGALSGEGVASMATTDVGAHKAKTRSTRLQRLAGFLAVVATLLILRDVFDPGLALPTLSMPSALTPYLLPLGLILLLTAVMVVPLLAAGKSPHILYRPDELTMTFGDVRGSDGLVE